MPLLDLVLTAPPTLSAWQRLATKFNQLGNSLLDQIPLVIVGLIVLVVFYILSNIVGRAVSRASARFTPDPSLQLLFGRMVKWAIILLGFSIVLTIAVPGFNLGSVITGLGVGGIIVGFAFRDILENYFAGIYFLVARPFRLGNTIRTNQIEGVVEVISTRAVHLRRFNRELEVIPCVELFKSRFTVVDDQAIRRFQHIYTLPHGTDIGQIEAAILPALEALPALQNDPAPFLVVEAINAVGIECSLYFYMDTLEHGVFATRTAVHNAVAEALQNENIPFAIPTNWELSKPTSEA